jgi:hypothetical protein
VWVTTTLWLTASAFAQDAFVERRSELLARHPAGVEFSIAAPKGEFYLGEVILSSFASRPRARPATWPNSA